MRRRMLSFLAVVAIALAPLAVASPASAAVTAAGPAPVGARPGDVDDFSFESMTADYRLGRDAQGYATLRVTERIVALFPDSDQNRGIVRWIPTRDDTTRADYGVRIVRVTDGDGGKVPFESDAVDRDGKQGLVLALGDDRFVHGRTTYVIEYTERNVARHFGDTGDDEFYWDVNGNDSAQPFGAVSARVRVPDALRSASTGHAACYTGGYSSTQTCAIGETADGWSASATDLAPYAGMTIAIGFRSGTFREPPTPSTSWLATVAPWILLGVVAVLLALTIVARLALWRDAPGRGTVIPQYEAPEEVGVLESAHFLHRGDSGLPATFVQFAVSGAAKLVERPDAGATDRYALEYVDAERLDVHDDRRAFDALFPPAAAKPGDVVVLDRGSTTLGDRLARLDSGARAELDTDGLITRVKSRLSVVLRLGALLAVIGAAALGFWAANEEVRAGALWIAVLLGGGVALALLLGAARAPRRLTRTGALLREHLLGLRDYLTLAEKDRLRVLQSPTGAERTRVDADDPTQVVKLYEKLLPWAMVWGLEQDWAQVIGERYATTPPTTGQSLSFADGYLLSSFARGMAPTAFATTPVSTGSSGSSFSSSFGSSSFSGGSFGGGFSGGGGGGGGFGGR